MCPISPLQVRRARDRDDAISITSTLLSLGVSDATIDAAVDFVLLKRNERGRWVLEGAPGPLDARFGTKGKENKWMTFRALRMLKLAGRLEVSQLSTIFILNRKFGKLKYLS